MTTQEPIHEMPSVESLIEKLQDKSSFVRVEAATALGELQDTRAVDPLVALLGHFDKNSQIAAAKALGDIGSPKAIEPLSSALARESFETYDAIKDALTKLGAADSVTKVTASRAKVEAIEENRKTSGSLFLWGGGLLAIGLLCTLGSYALASLRASQTASISGFGSAQYFVFTLPIVVGGILLTIGFFRRQGAVNLWKIIASIGIGFFGFFTAIGLLLGIVGDTAKIPPAIQIPVLLGMLILAFILSIRMSLRSWRAIVIVGSLTLIAFCLAATFF